MRLSAIDDHARERQSSASELPTPDLRYALQAKAHEVICASVIVDFRLRLALGKHSIWELATRSGARDDASGFALLEPYLLWYKKAVSCQCSATTH